MDYKAFERICAEKGVAPSRVATDLGMSSGSASFWKKGGNPSEKTVRRLADYLGVTVADLEEKPSFSYSYDEMKRYVTEFVEKHEEDGPSEIAAIAVEAAPDLVSMGRLLPDEKELLKAYRSLSRSKQHSLMSKAWEWAEEKEKEKDATQE